MKEHWPLEASKENTVYNFLSRGPKGDIKMTIQFSLIEKETDEVFNLAFGELNKDGTINDFVINNNGDMKKIIGTVIAAVHEFTHYYPDKLVYFTGSSNARNRLYRGVITIYLTQWLQNYIIWGLKSDNTLELFKKNKSYLGYLIKRK